MKQASIVCLAALAALSGSAATWISKAAGEYDWGAAANWSGGTLPTAATDALLNGGSYRPAGDQTISGDGAARTLDLHNNTYGTVRTFTGDIAASNLVLRVGTLRVEGTLALTGTDQTHSLVGAAVFNNADPGGTLDIRAGGTVRADGVHGLCVGRRAATDNTDAAGRVVLRDGGTLVLNPSGATASMSGLLLGRLDGSRTGTYSASYVQEGGEAVLGRVLTGFEKSTFASLAVLGGTLDLPYIDGETRFRVGHFGYGAFQLLGGAVYAETNYTANLGTSASRFATRASAFEVGIGRSIASGLRGAYFYAAGGVFATGSDLAISGATGADTGASAPVHATIDGAASVTARTVRVGANAGATDASLNLNGGVLAADFIFANEGRAGASVVNANGGRIVFGDTALQQQFLFLDAVNVYEGGLEIEVARIGGVYIGNAGTNVLLRTPAGYGVDIARVAEVNASLTPPWVEISGGSGAGAAIVTLVDWGTDRMTNAVVACRGEGYAADDAPVATLVRPYGTTTLADRITLSVSENRPGALVKTGGQSLYLFAQPEFAGAYEVRQGLLIQTTTAGVASPKATAVVVGGDGATFQCGSGNDTACEANWNPVNTNATLTLGTDFGPGTFILPRACPAETKPFRQTFASLAVNGTGNAISHQNNNGSTNGWALAFGTVACAEGAEVTIPHWESAFRVYVTGQPAGTRLKGVRFSGTAKHAMVGEDGQLVPAADGTTIVIR